MFKILLLESDNPKWMMAVDRFWRSLLSFFSSRPYFATAETAFASASGQTQDASGRGDGRAKKALWILENFDRAITTILIGTNIVHIVIAAMVTVFVTRNWGISAITVSTILTTIVVFFIGEMLPKSIAKKYSERLALSTAGSLYFFMAVFSPLAVALTAIGKQRRS
jgi:Mg2+/Co2+ transporter CorB